MIVRSFDLHSRGIIVEIDCWIPRLVDRDDFETFVDDNNLRDSLEENFDGEYSNRTVKLSWTEYYEQTKVNRDLEWFLAQL